MDDAASHTLTVHASNGAEVIVFTNTNPRNPSPACLQIEDAGSVVACLDLGPVALRRLADALAKIADGTTPTHPRPDAEPAAYTCEECEEETADQFAWLRGEWVPVCEECA